MATGASNRRALWAVYLLLFIGVEVVTHIVGPPAAISALVPLSGLATAAIGAATLVVTRTAAVTALSILYLGLATAATGNLFRWLTATHLPSVIPVPDQALVLGGHVIAALGVVRWLRTQGPVRRRPEAPVVSILGVLLLFWATAWWTGGRYLGLVSGLHFAAVLRLGVDSALLVWIMQVATVAARRNRAFVLLRLAFVLMIASDAALAYGSFTTTETPNIPDVYRTLAAAP